MPKFMIIPTIDHDFSVYQLVQKLQPSKLFTAKRDILSSWCHKIEDEVIQQELSPDVFACFQQLQYFVPMKKRYETIAMMARQAWIFGQPDVELPEIKDLGIVHLHSNDQLRREWFLIIYDEEYKRAIIAREVTEPGTIHNERVFEGIRTDHEKTIEAVYNSLVALVKPAQQKT